MNSYQDQIFKQKESLILWKNDLLCKLSCPIYYSKEEIYLITQNYYKNFENNFLNQDIINNIEQLKKQKKKIGNIDKDIEDLKKILNEPKKKLNDLPKIFPLNKNNYNLFKKIMVNIDNNTKEEKKVVGIIYVSLLKIKINEILYLFYFLDNSNNLRQGFLKVKNQDLLEQIMSEMEQSKPNFFVKDKTGKSITDKEININEANYDLYIIGNLDFNIKKLQKELNEFNEVKASRIMSKSMLLPISKKEISEYYHKVKKNNIKIVFNYIGNIFGIKKKNQIILKKLINNFNNIILMIKKNISLEIIVLF